MSEEYFKIKKTVFPKCETEVIFYEGLNIVTGDYQSKIHSHAPDLLELDQNNEVCIWSDSYAHTMHPTQLKMEARNLIQSVSEGLQGIVFTDSLFMMRELDILAHSNNMPVRYINFYFDKDELKVEQSDSIEGIIHLSISDESLEQADKYLRM